MGKSSSKMSYEATITNSIHEPWFFNESHRPMYLLRGIVLCFQYFIIKLCTCKYDLCKPVKISHV